MKGSEEIASWMTFTGKNVDEVLRFYGGDWYVAESGGFGIVMRNDVIYNPYVMDPIPNNYVLYKTKESDRVCRMEQSKFHATYPDLGKITAKIDDSFTSEERKWIEDIGGYDERQGDSSTIMNVYFDEDWSYYINIYKISSGVFECRVLGDRECDDYESVYGNTIQEAMVKALLVCRKTLVERIENANKS